jgi:hypothetical protein
VADATPEGAADCPQGRAAPRGFHVGEGFEEGTLAQGGIRVFIDGMELIANATVIPDLQVGIDHVVEIDRPGLDFRGLLFRIGGGSRGTDTTAALTFDEELDILQICQPCFSQYGVRKN